MFTIQLDTRTSNIDTCNTFTHSQQICIWLEEGNCQKLIAAEDDEQFPMVSAKFSCAKSKICVCFSRRRFLSSRLCIRIVH